MNHRCTPQACPTGPEAATQFSMKLGQGEISGLLAYIDEKPVGWCAIDKTITQVGHDFVLENPDEVLAFPIPEKNAGKYPKDLAEFSGRLSTYKSFGFQPEHQLNDFYEKVSLKLLSLNSRTRLEDP